MATDFQQHKIAYLVLILIIIGFIVAFMSYWPNRMMLKMIVAVFMLGYFLWGVVVHRRAGHINTEIIKEYGLVALVGGIVLLLLTY